METQQDTHVTSHLHPVITWSPDHRCDGQAFLLKSHSSVIEFPGLKQQSLKTTSVRQLPFPFLNTSWQMRTFLLAALISLFSSFFNSRPFCSSKSPIYSSAQVERRPSPLRSFSPQLQKGFFFFWRGGFHEREPDLGSSAWLWRHESWDLSKSWISFTCLGGCEKQCSTRRTNVPLQEIPNKRKWCCVRWVGGEAKTCNASSSKRCETVCHCVWSWGCMHGHPELPPALSDGSLQRILEMLKMESWLDTSTGMIVHVFAPFCIYFMCPLGDYSHRVPGIFTENTWNH